jgi:hypothetical protein
MPDGPVGRGADGADGGTPLRGADGADGGTPLRGADGADGGTPLRGADGADGGTPLRGADYVLAQPDFASNGENRWTSVQHDTLCWPYGLSLCGNTLAVADSGNNRVMLWRRGQESS